jgi:3'(2'), 5'-bisphosphate nucleotidase
MILKVQDIKFLKTILQSAGYEILKHYKNLNHIDHKDDGSPVTIADAASEQIIIDGIKSLTPYIPVVAEELTEAGHAPDITQSDYFWLVDPLDGTKEFIKGSSSFVINIALIRGCTPIFGMVYVPVSGDLYYGGHGIGAYLNDKSITIKPYDDNVGLTMIGREKQKSFPFIQQAIGHHKITEFVTQGSSIKFCMIADGTAHFYPRFVPTYEWDTAAAHAMLLELGGDIIDFKTGKTLQYRKDNFLNGYILTATNEVLNLFPDLKIRA